MLGNAVVAHGGLSAAHGGAGGDAAVEDLAAESEVAVRAVALEKSAPVYPQEARAEGVEADVALQIVVDATGRVSDARVVRRAGYGFDDAALTAMRAYRFSPAQKDGHPVRVRMSWSVSFRLR